MPLVRVALREGKSTAYRQALSDGIHRAMVETINVPEDDRFQVITEHSSTNLIYDPNYLGIARSDDFILIQITMSVSRTVEQKQALYRRIAELLAENPGVRPEDIFVNLVEVSWENWSFGNGLAQYVNR